MINGNFERIGVFGKNPKEFWEFGGFRENPEEFLGIWSIWGIPENLGNLQQCNLTLCSMGNQHTQNATRTLLAHRARVLV